MTVSIILDGFADVRLQQHSGTILAYARAHKGDNFILEAGRDDIKNYARHGNDLIVEFADGQRLTIKDFFAAGIGYHNLVLESVEGHQELVDFTHAMRAPNHGPGDGVHEASIVHHAVYAGEHLAQSDGNVDAMGEASIDQGETQTDQDEAQSDSFKSFLSDSFVPVLGGLGSIAAVAGYALSAGDDGDGDGGDVSGLWSDIADGEDLSPDPLLPGDPHIEDDKSPQDPPPSLNPAPSPILPDDPHIEEDNKQDQGQDQKEDSGQEKADSDLRFFKTTGYHFVESRVVSKDGGDYLHRPIFFRTLPVKESADQTGGILPVLKIHYVEPYDLYENIYAKVNANLAKGEKVQLRANDGEWRDADPDSAYNGWKFSQKDLAELKASGAKLQQIDSRIVDASGQVKQSDSFAPHDIYDTDRPAIAYIDTPLLVMNSLEIGGKVYGQFAEGNKIQIRIDGGGWYDIDGTAISKDGINVTWVYGDLPTYTSSAANDKITLEEGVRDTIFYRLLDKEDATGGNGSDIIHNFKIGQWGSDDVDRIDLTSLLIDYDGNPTHYISAQASDGNTVLYLYRDGVIDSNSFTPMPLITLIGVQTTIDELYNNGQLILT